MKLKYYLRGLGIGIAVMAVIMMITGGGKESLTDAEIMERARELGMVESVTLSELNTGEDELTDSSEVVSEAPVENTSETKTSEQAESASEAKTSEQAENASEAKTSEEAEGSSETKTSEEAQKTSEEPGSVSGEKTSEAIEEFVIVEVGRGDGSDTVSNKLAAMGLVESAREYDRYLCNNGYDKILQTGVHEIPKGSDWETIAKILSGR